MLDLEPHDLADAQAGAIAERQQNAYLQLAGHHQELLRLGGGEDLGNPLRLLDVMDLVGQIEPPHRDAEQPGHRAVASWIEVPVSIRCSWNWRTSSTVAVSGERFSQAANRLQARTWPVRVAFERFREAISSSMR